MQNPKELWTTIDKAQKLHGHLGPFLVIGVRMGMIAKKTLNLSEKQCVLLKASIRVLFFPPFSCLIDGIQASTTCTVGNQRLRMENSEQISASFAEQNVGKTVKLTLKPMVIEELRKRLAEGTLTQEFAMELVHAPENELFEVETL